MVVFQFILYILNGRNPLFSDVDLNRRESIYAWLFGVVLVASTLGFAATQFRWIGQLSEGERERLRRGLDMRLRKLARNLDRTIHSAMDSFTPVGGTGV